MYGVILGDIIGSPCEFDRNNYKAKDFPLFSERSQFTDDTVMTLAAAATRWLASPAASPRLLRRAGCTEGGMPRAALAGAAQHPASV